VLPVGVHELAGEPLGILRPAGFLRTQADGAGQEHRDVLGRVGEAESVEVDHDDVGSVYEHVGRRVLPVGRNENKTSDGSQGAYPLQMFEERARVRRVAGCSFSEVVSQLENLDPVAGRLGREACQPGSVQPGQPAGDPGGALQQEIAQTRPPPREGAAGRVGGYIERGHDRSRFSPTTSGSS